MATFSPSAQIVAGKFKWTGGFAGIPHTVIDHPTYAGLSGNAVKMLFVLARQYSGKNNGHLTATATKLHRYGFHSKDSIAKGLAQLIDFGHIVRTRRNVFKDAARYAITWLPIDEQEAGYGYDPGMTPGDEALDLWRHVNPHTIAAAA